MRQAHNERMREGWEVHRDSDWSGNRRGRLGAWFRVRGLGFGVWGLGIHGSEFRVQGSGFRVQGSGFRVWGLGFGAQGSDIRV